MRRRRSDIVVQCSLLRLLLIVWIFRKVITTKTLACATWSIVSRLSNITLLRHRLNGKNKWVNYYCWIIEKYNAPNTLKEKAFTGCMHRTYWTQTMSFFCRITDELTFNIISPTVDNIPNIRVIPLCTKQCKLARKRSIKTTLHFICIAALYNCYS